jgi:hypothetical protein
MYVSPRPPFRVCSLAADNNPFHGIYPDGYVNDPNALLLDYSQPTVRRGTGPPANTCALARTLAYGRRAPLIPSTLPASSLTENRSVSRLSERSAR